MHRLNAERWRGRREREECEGWGRLTENEEGSGVGGVENEGKGRRGDATCKSQRDCSKQGESVLLCVPEERERQREMMLYAERQMDCVLQQ